MPCAPRGRWCGVPPRAPRSGAWSARRSNMPPGPIEGSCLPSPTATSFAPERSIRSVRASRRLWSTIPASSKNTVVAAPICRRPVFARATSASSVSVRPASAGLSAPRRSAVEPETATPITSRPAICSARAAASITTPLPVPAGPIRTARRSGPVTVAKRVLLLARQGCGDALGDLSARVLPCACSPTSRPAGSASSSRGARSPAPARGPQRRHPPALQRQDSPLA